MEEIAEKNRMIAAFMDASSLNHDNPTFGYYHNSWSWLMPAVEKIKSFRDDDDEQYLYSLDILQTGCSLQVRGVDASCNGFYASTTLIESVYDAVAEFVNWYCVK